MIKETEWKYKVKLAVNKKNEKELKKEIEKLDKVKEFSSETFEQKD